MKTKTVYIYDDNGFFVTAYPAQESPLEPGVYLTPNQSTDVMPPEILANTIPKWLGNGSWELVPNFEGVTYYTTDGIEEVFEQKGVALPQGATLTLPPKTVDGMKLEQLKLIGFDFRKAVAQITGSTPPDEISSWAKQESEARAWLADNSASTPLIDAISSTRVIDKSILVDRVIAKADAFAGLVGGLIGKRQALEDQIEALPNDATEAQIRAVVWS